ncbi:MAG: hypothetical protein CBB69_003055 [Phycisphaera sp. TMED9]|nr:MAG: hypothetical protein CBB69_003055 [Phycisphaera sp. TMED9]
MIWLLIPLIVATMLVLGARSDDPLTGLIGLGIMFEHLWAPAVWLLAAGGVGSGLVRLLNPQRGGAAREIGLLRTWALGVAGLIAIDLVLGVSGALASTNVIRVLTGLLAMAGLWSCRRIRPTVIGIGLAASLPIGTLLLAATSAPGWLWGTEFGGFDALSYHLQLPREWWIAGAIIETPHNAYGYLPNGVEAAFFHVMTMIGDPADAAISCQLLVACVALLAAGATGDLAVAMLGRDERLKNRNLVGQLGFVALLATPWMIVVGSLAYDEAVVLFLGTMAFAMIIERHREPLGDSPHVSTASSLRFGAVLGILLGGAVLAKASSGLLVVVPASIAAALSIPRRDWFPIVLATAVAGVLICIPWLIRNAIWTGNPLFPFASSILGSGDWTAEQMARFATGHRGTGVVSGLQAIGSEFLFEDWLSPDGGDPQRLQWAWLPLTGLVALAVLLFRGRDRGKAGVILWSILVSIIAWALFSHAKARFLLPIAPLLAAPVAIIAARLLSESPLIRRGIVATLVWLAAASPAIVYALERQGFPAAGVGSSSLFNGDFEANAFEEAGVAGRTELLRNASPAFVLNHRLPTESRILLLGKSDPFHLDFEGATEGDPRISYQTVWTRGPFEEAIASEDPDTPLEDQVASAIDELKAMGYTHLYLQLSMLDRWTRSGWLAAELQPPYINAILRQRPDVRRFGDQAVLIEL